MEEELKKKLDIKIDKLVESLYAKQEEYLKDRLYFKCDSCGELRKLSEGNILRYAEDIKYIEEESCMKVIQLIQLLCNKCEEAYNFTRMCQKI